MKSKALLIVDHGSNVPQSNIVLNELAAIIRKLRPGLLVHTAHLDILEPSIAQGFLACVKDGATEIVVHPYILTPGRHATHDVPHQVKAIAEQFPNIDVTVTAPLGLDEKIALVVLEHARL